MIMESLPEKGKLLEWLKEKYEGCIVKGSRSEAGNWMELKLEHIERGLAEISLTVRKEMTNPYGNIHGGMMCLVVDEAIGWAVISMDSEHHYTSMNLCVDFLYAAREGERLTAKSVVIRQGKKIVNAECSVYDGHGNLLAKAHSNLIATNMQIRD